MGEKEGLSTAHQSDALSSTSNPHIEEEGGVASATSLLVPTPTANPRDPLNWPFRKKVTLLFVVCLCAWSGTLAPPSGQLAYIPQTKLYGKSPTELTYSISAAVAGLLAGPIFVVPLSNFVGRTSVIFWSLIGVFACQIWAASMTSAGDYNAFIISRLFAGLFGGTPTVLGAGTIMDLFFLHQRGRAFACYELSLLLGVVASPTIGGFIAQDHPWPLAFWWTLAPIGVAIILIFIFGEETRFARGDDKTLYPVLENSFVRSRFATLLPGTRVAPRGGLWTAWKSFIAPFKIGLSPVTIIAGLYMFVSFGFTIMLAILLAIYLQSPARLGGYGFSPRQNAAFTFVSWITIIVAQLISIVISDRLPLWAARRYNGGIWRPEFRLWNMWLPCIVAPVGLAIVGVALHFHAHYLVLALGSFLVGTAAQLSVPLLLNYVTECYTAHAVEVSVAMNVFRLTLGLVVAFFVEPWTEAVGQGWLFGMASLFVAGAGICTIILAWKGHVIRQTYPIKGLASSEDGAQVAQVAQSQLRNRY